MTLARGRGRRTATAARPCSGRTPRWGCSPPTVYSAMASGWARPVSSTTRRQPCARARSSRAASSRRAWPRRRCSTRTNIRFTSTVPSPCRRMPAQPIGVRPTRATRKLPSGGANSAGSIGVSSWPPYRRTYSCWTSATSDCASSESNGTSSSCTASSGTPSVTRTRSASSSSAAATSTCGSGTRLRSAATPIVTSPGVAQDADAQPDRAGLRHPERQPHQPGAGQVDRRRRPRHVGDDRRRLGAEHAHRQAVRPGRERAHDGEDRERRRGLRAGLHRGHPVVHARGPAPPDRPRTAAASRTRCRTGCPASPAPARPAGAGRPARRRAGRAARSPCAARCRRRAPAVTASSTSLTVDVESRRRPA